MNLQSGAKAASPKAIYYDGTCPMCTVLMDKIGSSKAGESFDMKDATSEPLPRAISKEAVERGIHVVDADGTVHKNSQAILSIMAEYPRWKFLARIGKLPVIRQALEAGYRLISLHRHFLFGRASRIFWLKVVVAAGLCAGLISSFRLWAGARSFPLVPAFRFLPALPPAAATILFGLLLALLLAVIFVPRPRKLIICISAIALIFAVGDQMRWQPWFYQYAFMLGSLAFFSWNPGDEQGGRKALNTNRLIIGSIYFFSGLQKVNVAFMGSIFPWLIAPVAKFFPAQAAPVLYAFGILVPFMEMAIGIGLFSKKFRTYAVIGALLMHGFILFSIGPFGHDWNSVVWPWNIAMMLLVLILFYKARDFSFRDLVWIRRFPYQKAVLVLFAVMPIASFFNMWDSYLSSTLYSGNTNSARLSVSDSVAEKLPAGARQYLAESRSGGKILDFSTWSFAELNVPPYPETRIFKAVGRYACRYADAPSDVLLDIYGKPTMFNRGWPTTYTCRDL
ncbi:MAG: DCC1-like thiol-disulfide oxidoreductase family protein [bacterium]